MTRVLITGASGFVGRHLVEYLGNRDELEIIGMSSRQRPPIPQGRLLVCDLRDADLTARVVERHQPDVIYHLAGQSHVPRAFAEPADTLITNAVGQINLLEGCRRAGIDPVILVVSSAEVYGAVTPEDIPISEDQPLNPNNPYASSKATQDLYARQYHAGYGMKTVTVRPFNHVGPGQSDRFVISSFARQIAEAEAGLAEPVILVGNLDAVRDFLDVRDVVRAYAMLADASFAGSTFNLASGRGVRIQEVLDRLVQEARCGVEIRTDPQRVRPSEVPEFRGDASKLRLATGWEPAYPLEETIRDILDDWRERIRNRSPS